jgi:hypothetical protein
MRRETLIASSSLWWYLPRVRRLILVSVGALVPMAHANAQGSVHSLGFLGHGRAQIDRLDVPRAGAVWGGLVQRDTRAAPG